MIDIFGTIEQRHDITELLVQSIGEFGVFLFRFLLLLGLLLLLKRFFTKKAAAAAVLLPLLQIAYVWSVSTRTEFLYSFCFALLLTLQLFALRSLPLHKEDYFFFFSALLFPNRLFNSSSAILGDLWMFWIIFLVLYGTAVTRLLKLYGNHFHCYFLFLTLSLSGYLFRLSVFFIHPALAELMGSSSVSLICTTTGVLTLLTVSSWLIRRRFQNQLVKLNRFGSNYPGIERYFFGFSILILALCTLIFLPFPIMDSQNGLVALLFPALCLSLLWAQLPFIRLLYHTAFYKDSAAFSRLEKEGLASYYQSLSGSLAGIQEMRHDVKNIFYTMGNFVDRSEDPQMKAFFWEKIYPYSIDAIRQSELLTQLYHLPSEPLLAFFYLKLSQALNQEIPVTLKVNLIPEQFQTGMDVLDLTRILGILLDNAMEEAVLAADGLITVKITGNHTGCSYIIKNTLTEETQAQGIGPGKTSKGSGHGNGLAIVRRLLESYPNAALNSSVQNGTYVQSLNLTFS